MSKMDQVSYVRESAIEGSGNPFQRIEESGEYVGVFTSARKLVAKTGAEGIEFTFKSNQGVEARYLTLYAYNAAGGAIFGHKQLCAILALLKVKTINAAPGVLPMWDARQGKEVPTNCQVYPELINKPIGLLLQKESYTKNDGGIGDQMNLYGFFEPETRRTAKEVLEDLQPETIDKMLKTLKDTTRKGNGAATKPAETQQGMDYGAPPVGADTAEFEPNDDLGDW